MRTFLEVKEYLIENIDEITLLEMLNIDSKDIVEMFSDRVEEKYNKILEDYEL